LLHRKFVRYSYLRKTEENHAATHASSSVGFAVLSLEREGVGTVYPVVPAARCAFSVSETNHGVSRRNNYVLATNSLY
jgi:hypothetical protein